MNQEFDIATLLRLTEQDKYATTVAGFETIDMNAEIEVPKKIQRRKPAVRSLYTLSSGLIQWDYISDERREELRQELGISQNKEQEGSLESLSTDHLKDASQEPASQNKPKAKLAKL